MISCAFGILHMLATESYTYMFFPLVGILWGVYSIFDENDKEHVRRNGNDNRNTKKNSWWWGENEFFDYDYNNVTSYRGSYRSQASNTYKQNPSKDYKHIATKCKRNFKITVGDKKNG